MRLQKIVIKGFKSFADKTILPIEHSITGFVGPNGCGKSNIADAIKWVLGEQSAKNLRGDGMDDIIFNGTDSRKKTNLSEVTLVFDNTNKRATLNFSEISLTRRLYRGEGKNEYYINKELVRYRDLQNLVFDVGLGKGSLGIISQGMISSFAEAKPIERRLIFEEAANVSKYKKRKEEAQRKLVRVDENLVRINDIIFELEKQLKPLAQKAQKAKAYLDIKAELEKTELSYLVYELNELNKKITSNTIDMKEFKIDLDKISIQLDSTKYKSNLSITKIQNIDKKIQDYQNEFLLYSQEITKIEALRMAQITQSEKIHDSDFRAGEIIQESNELSKNIFLNKKQKYDFEAELRKCEEKINANQENKTIYQNQEGDNNQTISELTTKKEIIQDRINQNNHLPKGVQTVVKNTNVFSGIMGLVKDIITPKIGYEIAINSVLRGVSNHIIVQDEKTVKNIIRFLQNNRGGWATFIPLETIRQNYVTDDTLIACQMVDGFIGVASDFVEYKSPIKSAVEYYLGATLLVKNFGAAIDLKKATLGKHRIITTEGEIFNKGGSIAGGSYHKVSNKNELLVQIREIDKRIANLITQNKNFSNKIYENDIIDKELQTKREKTIISIARFDEIIIQKEHKLNGLELEYKDLTGLTLISKEKSRKKFTIDDLDNLKQKRNTTQKEIETLQKQKDFLMKENKKIADVLQDLQEDEKTITKKNNESRVIISNSEYKLQSILKILNQDYQLTYEYAKENIKPSINPKEDQEEVKNLRAQIKEIGNVDVESISQYEEINQRHNELSSNYSELDNAKNILLQSISEMDKKVTENFGKTFNAINFHFQQIFKKLFGGGYANLEYSDFDNILESGIEVKAQPPGKKVALLNLLSGGEKSLVALSVLFAILKVNPLPLCVLDEVESALDLVNLDRFANYLEDFASQTQFLVITHRSETMEKCGIIFGITMLEKGISKLISVKLEDAIKTIKTN